MNTLLVILAHGEVTETFKRHEPFWKLHGLPLLVMCPETDPVMCEHETHRFGEAAHTGKAALGRFSDMLETLSKRSWDRCIVHEYDSLFLRDEIPKERGFYGACAPNSEYTAKFMAFRYSTVPWVIDRDSFKLILAKHRAYPSVTELGFYDRVMSALASLAGVPVLPFDPPAFSLNTIENEHTDNLKTALSKGCFAFHGIKTKAILDVVTSVQI